MIVVKEESNVPRKPFDHTVNVSRMGKQPPAALRSLVVSFPYQPPIIPALKQH